MSRCKRCGVLIDFDDDSELKSFDANGECHGCSMDGMNIAEEIDDDVRSKWMDNNGDNSEGL